MRCVFGDDEPGEGWRTGAELLDIRGDFGCVRDSKGRSQFSVFLPTLMDDAPDEAREWVANWQHPSRRYTHAIFAPSYGYPGSPIAGRTYSPDEFVTRMRAVLDMGISPVIWLADFPHQYAKGIEIVKALKADGLLPYVICVPACEPIPTSYTTSRELSDFLIAMKRAGGDEIVIGMHLQPGRWSFASHPLEADDPWRGNEQGCWKSHGGEFVSVFLYQLEHDGWDEKAANPLPFEIEDRWRDGVPRMGNGMNGWRVLRICAFETTLYNDYQGQFTHGEKFARRVAAKLRDVAKEYGVTVTFGNGAPEEAA